jgi:CRISPR type III-A-associated RAMP protein Csm4
MASLSADGTSMNTYAVYLYPRGPLASPLSSETLFGAVCWGIQTLGGDVGQLLDRFVPPLFAFSAAFPMLLIGKHHQRFYPRPITFEAPPAIVRRVAAVYAAQHSCTLKAAQVKVAEAIKRDLKPVNYLSESVLARVVSGQFTVEQWLLAMLNESRKEIAHVGNLLLTGDEYNRWPQKDERDVPLTRSAPRLHNQIDRVAGATAEGLLFYQDEINFGPGAGLWAALRASQQNMDSLIRPALRYLQDTGFGANRSVGQGHFDITLEPMTTLPDGGPQANGFMTLSRYLPASGEVTEGDPLAYKLITLRGKRESRFPQPDQGMTTLPIFKRSLRVFEPGSVFPLTQRREVYGRLAEAIPAENDAGPTFQSGLALPIFLRVA